MAGFQQLRVTREVNFVGAIKKGLGTYDIPGRVYYVNNITGSSANNGLTWDTAMDEVSTAITASEAYRQLQGTDTNDYIRNTIVVQGTGTAYTQLTALPSYCDVIGLGGDPRGNGSGIARIGPDEDGEGAVDGVNADACRGSNFYNLQFQAGSVKTAFDCDKMFRCRIENCGFMGNLDATSPSAGLLIGTTGTWGFGASGLVIKDCLFGTSYASNFTTGISLAGTHFHNCVIENCVITGTTGILVASVCTAAYGTVVRDNTIISGYAAQTASLNDDATEGHIAYVNNLCQIKPTMANAASTRSFGNVVADETAFTGGFSNS